MYKEFNKYKTGNKYDNTKRVFVKGEIYWVDFPEQEKGSHIQSGLRPAIIMTNKKAGMFSPTVHCIPITTEIKKENLPVHAILNSGDLREVSMVLGEQLGNVDTYRIKDKIGKVSNDDMVIIDNIAVIQLDINIEKLFLYLRYKNNNRMKKVC